MVETAWLCAQTDDADATRALAGRFSVCIDHGDVLVLTGDLGAGKTCFTQGLGAGLGVEGRITSPTFTLVSGYQGRLPLHHLDVYRLDDLGQTLDLDLPELLEEGVTVIEWGERIEAVLPADRATIELRFAPVTSQPCPPPDGAAEPDGDANEDHRQLRIELAGPSWMARRDQLAAALQPWIVPC